MPLGAAAAPPAPAEGEEAGGQPARQSKMMQVVQPEEEAFSWMLLHHGRHAVEVLVAVEPDAVNRRVLQRRIDDWDRSGIGPIQVAPVAVGAKRGKLQFATTGTAAARSNWMSPR